MPVCAKCKRTLPSVEVRKNPTGPACKDKSACAARREKAVPK